jgi:hypothetical protein
MSAPDTKAALVSALADFATKPLASISHTFHKRVFSRIDQRHFNDNRSPNRIIFL